MIAHVVLYEMRSDLAPEDRERFNAALQTALRTIPTIRGATFGRRKTLGVLYEKVMDRPYEYLAILEFDDEAGLRGYLDHPAHAELGALFWSCSSRVLVFDYELAKGRDVESAFGTLP